MNELTHYVFALLPLFKVEYLKVRITMRTCSSILLQQSGGTFTVIIFKLELVRVRSRINTYNSMLTMRWNERTIVNHLISNILRN